jgi:hypothetical protein
MELDLTPFVKALREKDTKKVREWFEQAKGRVDLNDEFGRGYLLALQGMIAALEVGNELSVIKRMLNGEYKQEQIAGLVKNTRERLSRKFRPKDELGFDTAWVEVLQEFSEEKI